MRKMLARLSHLHMLYMSNSQNLQKETMNVFSKLRYSDQILHRTRTCEVTEGSLACIKLQV